MKKEFSTLDLLIIGYIKELNIPKRKFRCDVGYSKCTEAGRCLGWC